MATKTKSNPAEGSQEMLNQTDMGQFFSEHKNLLIAVVLVLILGVAGWGIYSYQSGQAQKELANDLHAFKSESISSFQEGKLEPSTFASSLREAVGKRWDMEETLPTVMRVTDLMLSAEVHSKAEDPEGFKEKAREESYELLTKAWSLHGSSANAYLAHVLGFRVAAVSEDTGHVDEAIKVLEELTSRSYRALEGKLHLDLGRLYLQKGNMEKAKINLEYVRDQVPDGKLKKMASLYLAQMNAPSKGQGNAESEAQ